MGIASGFPEEESPSSQVLKQAREALSRNASDEEIDRLYIRDIIKNRLAHADIVPCPGTLDALIDDMSHYLEKSLADFAEFIHENKRLDNNVDSE